MERSVFLLALLLIGAVSSFTFSNDFRIVETKSGRVRGIRKQTLLNEVEYYSFKGIPYAKAPIGKLRFKPPEPVKPWTPKTLDAFEYGNTCIRPNNLLKISDNFPQSEDCLFLNIFVPANLKPNEKLAILFRIHGGSFRDWSGNDHLFGPDNLVEQRVILVTLNYRLGFIGFISFGTSDYSGNMGLKDQQLALKWVHENIEQFSGDIKRITVFGQSAGGASTHLQVLSSESRKYLNNGISMSGTFGSLSNESNVVSKAFQIASDLGKPTNSTKDLIEFFKNVPSKYIANYTIWPILERADAKKPFVTKNSPEIYKSSHIDKDMIFYHASSELVVVFEELQNNNKFWEIAKNNFTIDFPFEFKFPPDSKEYREFVNEVRQFYFGNAEIDQHMKSQYLDMINDKSFVYANHKALKDHIKYSTGNSFHMQFSVNSTLNLLKRLNNIVLPGASHCDEHCYLFRSNACKSYYDEVLRNSDSEESEVCLQTINYLTQTFANFAKYGKPTRNLLADYSIQNNENIVLDISNAGLRVIEDPRKKSMKFWSDLERKAQIEIEDHQNKFK